MAKPRRYADGTKVAVSKSKAQIDKLLDSHGALQRIITTDELRGVHLVAFTYPIGDGFRRLRVERQAGQVDPSEERRTWRVLFMSLKMRLEAVRDGDSSLEREFLADLVLADGKTVHQQVSHQIADVYASGAKAPLLLGPAS